MSKSNDNGSLATSDVRLFETGNFADATIVCGDRTWKVHKLILSSRCKWFKAAFHGNLAEATSGKVVLEEQDADLIELLLHFIYAKDIDIPKLRAGKDIPAFCIQVFRLGDFFLLDDLKEKAKTELKVHIENKLTFLDTEAGHGQTPDWLTEILNALEEAYKDGSTRPILETLLEFVCLNKHKIFQFKDAVGLIDKIPEMAKDLIKSYFVGNMAAQPRPRFRLGLPVIAAVGSQGYLYELRTVKLGPAGSPKMPCLLYPMVGSDYSVFAAVNPKTDKESDSLGWMAPMTHRVDAITSHPDSEVVKIEGRLLMPKRIYIRFDDCGDARLYVERYCRANPEIDSMTASTAISLSTAMSAIVARVTGRSI